MIRMGRGNRTDEPNADRYEPAAAQPTTGHAYSDAASASPMRSAVTESDSMARDIKEGRLSGFVGHGTTLTGETVFQAMLRVDGHLIGTVSSDTGTLIIGSNGQVDANIVVAAAMISGTVNGDVVATEKIQLGRTARVIGNIQAPRLIVEEGAILEGSCSMIKAREAHEKTSVAATTSPTAVIQDEPASFVDDLDEDDDETADSASA